MRKLYSLLLLTAALVCLPWSMTAGSRALPYSYGFEDYNLETDGWTKANPSNKNNSAFKINGDSKRTGSYGHQFSSYTDNGENTQYLISPELSASNGVIVSFYYKNSKSGNAEVFKVGYSTTDAEIESFTFGSEISKSDAEWEKYENSFPAGTKYIAVYYYSTYKYYLYVDDFEFTGVAAGPALSVADGASTLSSGANYSFGLATAGTEKTFTLSNPGTESITLNIAATGGFGVSPASTTIAAKGEQTLTVTMANATAEGVVTITPVESVDPFTLNVSGTVRDASKVWCNFSEGLPEGWTNSSYTINISGAGAGTSGGGYATQSAYSYARLCTPKVSITENEKLYITVAGTSSYSTGNVQVQYSANGTDWTTAKTVSSIAYGTWTSVEVTEVPLGIYYIGFNGQYIYITDIYGGTPVALVKNVAAADITANGATISWTKHGSEDAWQVSYSTTSGDPDNGTIVDADSESKVLSGLNPTTTYYVSVRIGSNGEWSKEISFTTKCAAVDGIGFTQDFEDETAGSGILPDCWNAIQYITEYYTYPYVYNSSYYKITGSKYLYLYGGTTSSEQIAILPPFTNTADLYVTFNYKYYSVNANYGALQVGYITNPKNKATFTSLQTLTMTDAVTKAEVAMTSAPAGSYVAIRFGGGSSAGTVSVDDIEITAIPSCAKPTGLTASNVFYNSADLAWTAGGTEEAWNLRYKAGDAEWDTIVVNTTSKNLTDLTTGTTYTAQVQADCEGDWSNEVTFTPQCKTPTGLKLDSKTTTTATVSWTVNSGETEWNVQYKANADANWTTVEGVTANPYTIEGLTAGTIYQVKVAATCNGTYTSSIEFPTECAAKKLTFNEDFSTLTCWTMAECNSNTGLNDGAFRFRWDYCITNSI